MSYQQSIRVREVAVSHRPVNHRGSWILVALTDANGRVGYGEASHSTDDGATTALLQGVLSTRTCEVAWHDPAAAWSILRPAAPARHGRRAAATAARAREHAPWY